eukprot:232872-Pleurochrysis_carterae.AAC.1
MEEYTLLPFLPYNMFLDLTRLSYHQTRDCLSFLWTYELSYGALVIFISGDSAVFILLRARYSISLVAVGAKLGL